MHHDRVVILDAGAQYGKLIDRAIRELCVESVIMPMDTPADYIHEHGFKAIIISGGPGSVYDRNSPVCHPSIFSNENGKCLPILGICYGFQYINYIFNGVIQATNSREDGVFPIILDTQSAIYKGLNSHQQVLLTHGDSLIELGKELKSNALSGQLVIGLEHETLPIYGVQYHVEVDLTPCGREVLSNFLFGIAKCTPNFTLPNREIDCLKQITDRVKDGKVLLLLSGGVDSSTCLALLKKCLQPSQIIALHIDNGFLRHQESALIEKQLSQILQIPIKVVNASNRFLQYSLPYTDFFDMTYPGAMKCCLGKFISSNVGGGVGVAHQNIMSSSGPSAVKKSSSLTMDYYMGANEDNTIKGENGAARCESPFDSNINCCCCCTCSPLNAANQKIDSNLICKTFDLIAHLNSSYNQIGTGTNVVTSPSSPPSNPILNNETDKINVTSTNPHLKICEDSTGDNNNRAPSPRNAKHGNKKHDFNNIKIKHCDCCCIHRNVIDNKGGSIDNIVVPSNQTSNGSLNAALCTCCARNMKQMKEESVNKLSISGADHNTISSTTLLKHKNIPPSRAMEEALIKLGLGQHCYKNYDGSVLLKPLCKVINPEIKRRIIGDIFVQVADEIIADLKLDPNNVYFCQGTLRPDLIESASHLVSDKAEVIKTHHNDTKLMRMLRAQGKVIEPLKDFHKDEVRSLARDLHLPQEIVERRPFPGPGLAIRIICAMEPFMDKSFTETNFILKLLVQVLPEEYHKISHSKTIVKKLQDSLTPSDRQMLREVILGNTENQTSNIKYSAILLPIKSVGVQGDKRSYSYVCALSCTLSSNTTPKNLSFSLSNEKSPTSKQHASPPSGNSIGSLNRPKSPITPTLMPSSTGNKRVLSASQQAQQDLHQSPSVPITTSLLTSDPNEDINLRIRREKDQMPFSASVPWDNLFKLAKIIPKVCHNVNRIVYIFGPEYKHPITEVVPTYITPLTLGLIRKADHVAHTILSKYSASSNASKTSNNDNTTQNSSPLNVISTTNENAINNSKISQMPVVLLPLQFDRSLDNLSISISTNSVTQSETTIGKDLPWTYLTDDDCLRSVVLRPFVTRDFMTGIAAIPGIHISHECLDEMVEKLTYTTEGISRVLYDLTSKPPGTTEWE